MKMTIVFLSLLSFAIPSYPGMKPGVQIEYDEFKKNTSVTLVEGAPQGTNLAMFATAAKEDEVKNPGGKNITFAFSATSKSWTYLACHELVALADDQPVELGESTHRGDVGEGYVLEFVSVNIDLKTFAKLAIAKETKFRLCQHVYTVTPERRALMTKFLDALKDKKPAK
jgi:hypothetical protein